MRLSFILLIILTFGSFAMAQDERREEIPIRDSFPLIYSNSNSLQELLSKVAAKLKSSSELRAVIIYYKGDKVNKINFNAFKLKVQNILVKFNNIKSTRFVVITSSPKRYTTSFDIWIVDKDGKPIRDW